MLSRDIPLRTTGQTIVRTVSLAWRVIEPALVWLPPLLLVSPLLFLAYGSFAKTWDSRGIFGLSIDAYSSAYVFGRPSILFSLQVAALVTALVVMLAVPIAYALSRLEGPLPRLLRHFLVVPIVLPPMALAIGIILLYPNLLGTFLVFLMAHVVLTLPFAIWPVSAALSAIDVGTLEKAARTLGASSMQFFMLVVVPSVARAAVVGAAITFVVSFAEINASLFLSSAEHRPLSVALLNAFMNHEIRVAAALTVLFTLLVTPALVLMETLLRDGRRPQ